MSHPSAFGGNPAQRRQSLNKAAPRNIGPRGPGKGPFGTLIQPEGSNRNAERGSVVGGLQDASVPRSQMAGRVGLKGAGKGAAVSTAPAGEMKPPTPAPGQKGRAAAHPAAPSSLAMGKMGTRAGGSARAAAGKARQALRGGGLAGPMQVRQQRPPTLPDARPSFPKAANKGGRGTMSGTMQGGRGRTPGQSSIKPL